MPPAGTEETVTADPLPTAQINGVVWAQAIANNTVWVGGEFTAARPAGAAPGVSTVPRGNLMAYNLQTGVMTSWNPGANAKIKSIVASPDGTRIYVAGSFTTIAGQPRSRVAAFDTASGALLPWAPSANATVSAIATAGDTVFIAGDFSSLAGGSRVRLGAVRASNGVLLPLSATLAGGYGVQAIVVNPTATKVVVAGSFLSTNGSTNPGRGMAALNATTGATLPWAVNSLIRNAGTNAAMTALASDGDSVYGTGYDYGGGPEDDFEGTFRARWSDGALVWLEDCHGDNYSVAVSSGVVYTASHDHYCGNVGGFPQTSPSWTFRHTLAFAKEYHAAVLTPDIYGYKSYHGRPAGSLLHWFPNWQVGTYTGKSQATWNVTANSDYVVYGGEFLAVNGAAQQGLVRFAKKSIAPSASGPERTGASFPITATSMRVGEARLSWTSNYDRDNRALVYQVLRQDKGAAAVCTASAESNFWTTERMLCADKTVVPGTTYQYRVRAVDPHGNQALGAWTSVTATAVNRLSEYSLSVLDDGAVHYWALNEATGSVATDAAGNADLTVTGATRGQAGPSASATATRFAGTTASYASTRTTEAGPTTLSLEAWFKTTSTRGGKILSFGDKSTGNSTQHDRSLYLDNAGRVTFGVYPGVYRTLTSAAGLNNGQWHHVVGTLSPTGMNLYVDGVRVGTRTDATTAQNYAGFWRVGGDVAGSWPGIGSSGYLDGTIADVAVYTKALTAAQALSHAQRSTSPAPNQPPVASFTSQQSGLTVSVDGSASTDPDGTVTAYAWTFGDGGTASGASASHAYAAAGTYPVGLTVTDNRGATHVKTSSVTVSALPGGGGVLARDLFERAVTGGWGTADSGGTWVASPTPARFSVTGGNGVLRLENSTGQQATLGSLSSSRTQLAATFSVDKIANAQYISFIGRQVGANQYLLRVRVAADGSVMLHVMRGGTAIGAAYTVPGLTISPGAFHKIEFEVTGTSPTTLSGKMWKESDTEPAGWQVVRTDSTAGWQEAGSVAISSYVPVAAAAYPVTLAFAEISVTDPTLP